MADSPKQRNPGAGQESVPQAKSESLSTSEAQIVGKPEPPPMPPGQNINLALGMNLQRASFDSLDPEVQSQMIQLSDTLDKRQYDYYSKSLGVQAEYSNRELTDRGAARKQALVVFSLLGGCGILLIGAITLILLQKDQFQIAQTVAIAGITFAAGLLGGTGIPSILKQLSSAQ